MLAVTGKLGLLIRLQFVADDVRSRQRPPPGQEEDSEMDASPAGDHRFHRAMDVSRRPFSTRLNGILVP
jgi:hypothetical protein